MSSIPNQAQSTNWNDGAGPTWVELQPLLDGLFAPLLPVLLDGLDPARVRRLVDIGCGAGALTLAAAERLGDAACLGLDISGPLVAAARARVPASLADRVAFAEGDAQTFRFEPESCDAILSRFGVMFFDDPVAAFANLRGAARPGAGLAFLAWRAPSENPFMTAAKRATSHLVDFPDQRPDEPGQFGFADRGRVVAILDRADWREVSIEPIDVACTFPARDVMTYAIRLGPLGPLWPTLDPALQDKLRPILAEAFAPFVSGDEVRLSAACWLGRARA